MQNPLPSGSFLNVNFPYNCNEGIKGLRIARQGKSYWIEAPDKRLHPEGTPYYWLGGAWGAVRENPESDVTYLEQGYVTAVPIYVGELTCEKTYQKIKCLTEKNLTGDDELLPLEPPR